MLRCDGCGSDVSEWAARCSVCARPADEAALVAGPPAPEPLPMLPAMLPGEMVPLEAATLEAARLDGGPLDGGPLDGGPVGGGSWPGGAEPVAAGSGAAPPRPAPVRRRRFMVAGILATLAVGAIVARVAAGGGGGLPTGRVLSATSVGTIVLTAPDGTRSTPLTSVSGTGFFVAADGRFLATGTGQELVLRGATLTETGRDIPFDGPPGSWRAVDFTDGDRGLVATEDGLETDSFGIEAVTFDGQRTVDLGNAESAVGDPAALGVFAVVASDPGTAIDPLTDIRVERRDAGASPVVLATTAQLARDLGDAPGTLATLSVVADPRGDRVAALVVPDGGPPARPGIVVLDRNGAVIGATPVPTVGVGRPAWSPDGRTLVYDASTAGHPAVALWRIGHPPTVHAAPSTDVAGAYGSCVWAVQGSGYLCASSSSGWSGAAWLVGRAGSGSLVQVLGPTLPFAWFPTSGTVQG